MELLVSCVGKTPPSPAALDPTRRRLGLWCLFTAARAIAGQVTQAELGSGLLYPPQGTIVQTEIATAVRVCEVIFDRGLAGVERPADIRAFVQAQLYTPEYRDTI